MIHENVQFDLYFIRHGESENNIIEGIAAGANFDAPMTERGHRQSLALGKRLAKQGVTFDKIYSSTLVRAVQTTEGMLKGMGLESAHFERVPQIIERQIPAWRGKMANEVWTTELRFISAEKGKWFQPADGESEKMVERRAGNWLEDEVLFNPEWHTRPGVHRIAIISHGITMKALFHYITNWDGAFVRRTEVHNTSISRFRFGRSGWSVVSINDFAHTEEIGDVIRDGVVQGDTVVP
jgi:broad specificity phosphatase PhoE